MENKPWDKTWTHDKLYAQRFQAKTQDEQNALANAEHAAFAREVVADKPAMAIPLLAAIPVYQGAKALGLTSSRSEGGVEQAAAAYRGVQEGLEQAVKGPWDKAWGSIKESLGMASETPKKAPVGPWTEKPVVSEFDRVFNNLVKQESGGKHTTRTGYLLASGKGAQGITQVMPRTGVDPGYGVDPVKNNTKEEYIRFGKDYLRAMLNEFGGDMEKALAAYNAGPANVQKAIAKGGKNWKNHLPKKEETLPYIKNIMRNVDVGS